MKHMSKYNQYWVSDYFDTFGEGEWNRLTSTPVDEVSLYIHTHYLQKYVPQNSRVLEIGAGTGRFTQILAGLGCRILVADISQGQLDLNREYAEKFSYKDAIEEWQRLDICDMTSLDSESFDSVVCYGGPISYVFDKAEQAISQCARVLKKNGFFLASVMSLWGGYHRYLEGIHKIPQKRNRMIIDSGDLTPGCPEAGNHYCHMFRANEFRDLLVRSGLEIMAMSASNCVSTGWDDYLAETRSDTDWWDELLRIELEAAQEEGCLDMGNHLIGVARKP